MVDIRNARDLPDFQRQVFCLFGLPFDAVTVEQASTHLRAAAHERKRCMLITPNLNFVALARQDRRFRDSLLKNDLSLVDGMPLVWCARLLGAPLFERVSGSTVFEVLASHPPEPQMSVFLFGADDGVATLADQNINAESRGVRSVGYIEPGFGSIEKLSSPWMLDRINGSGADFLVVCLGARKGHLWIDHNLGDLEVPIVSHLGAVIKYTAGVVSRAPQWVQSLGLEWLWRIKEEPPLWARYMEDGLLVTWLMLSRMLPAAWSERRRSRRDLSRSQLKLAPTGHSQLLKLERDWCSANSERLRAALTRIARVEQNVDLDLSETSHLDSAVIGLLLLLRGHCLDRGLRMRVVAASRAARRALRNHCAEYLLDTLDVRSRPVDMAPMPNTDMAPHLGVD